MAPLLRQKKVRQSQKSKASVRKVPTTPKNYRTRAHATAWRQKIQPPAWDSGSPSGGHSLWFSATRRPYVPLAERRAVLNTSGRFLELDNERELSKPCVFHVDFTENEVEHLRVLACQILGLPEATTPMSFLKKKQNRSKLVKELPAAVQRRANFSSRNARDIEHFLNDLGRRQPSQAFHRSWPLAEMTTTHTAFAHGLARSARFSSRESLPAMIAGALPGPAGAM